MKICFIADARSPIAVNWINHFIQLDHDVRVISSYPWTPDTLKGATIYQASVALSSFSRSSKASKTGTTPQRPQQPSRLSKLRGSILTNVSMAAQHCILPFDLYRRVEKVRSLITEISPDIVHALRIPFEGILAAKATPSPVPLLISVWGNDFTLWAARNLVIARQTRQALNRADALLCDCRRDLNLGIAEWGFDSKKPSAILPGAGGIDTSLFNLRAPDTKLRARLNIADDSPVVINPRGFRGYVRNDIFFRAIPLVLREYPKAIFICLATEANPVAEDWVSKLSIKENVRLLPAVPHDQVPDLFRLSSVAVSPSLHDGTPNTLLEAMACGCFPVAFNIESVREWIDDESNGLLCEPDPESLAQAIARSLADRKLRDEARKQNSKLVADRAEYDNVMRRAEAFYREVINQKRVINE